MDFLFLLYKNRSIVVQELFNSCTTVVEVMYKSWEIVVQETGGTMYAGLYLWAIQTGYLNILYYLCPYD